MRTLLAVAVVSLAFGGTPVEWAADRAAARGWPVHRLDADHTPERSAREPLVALLDAVP